MKIKLHNAMFFTSAFVQDDVTVTGRRHIILASEAMMSLLGNAKTFVCTHSSRLLQTASRRPSFNLGIFGVISQDRGHSPTHLFV